MKNLADGQEHMISSDQFQIAQGATWTPDGKKLLFVGGVSAAVDGFAGFPRHAQPALFAFR